MNLLHVMILFSSDTFFLVAFIAATDIEQGKAYFLASYFFPFFLYSETN